METAPVSDVGATLVDGDSTKSLIVLRIFRHLPASGAVDPPQNAQALAAEGPAPRESCSRRSCDQSCGGSCDRPKKARNFVSRSHDHDQVGAWRGLPSW